MRRGWSLQLIAFFVVVASLAFGQIGNSTITGVVTDPAGAVVPGASVEAKNAASGVVYPGVTTNAGNYTITDVPVGTYVVTVKVQGFKTYTHSNIGVAGATTVAEDISLQVGNSAETVTVTAEATLLKTETGDLATNVTLTQIDELPLMGIGGTNSGTSGYRNWDNIFYTIPGTVNYAATASLGLNVNGLTLQSNLVEGQEATTRVLGQGGTGQYYQIGQMGVDGIQEMAVQTSNYAAEYGTASSVVINTTMKSGTNQYHGTGYDYFVNEDLNAGDPYSTTGCIYGITGTAQVTGATLNTPAAPACDPQGGSGGKFRPRNRRNDFGGTLGGPLYIPKIYNGHNKTFWFFSYEQYLETTFYSFSDTVATPAFIAGNFAAISPNGNCSLCSQNGIQITPLGGTSQKDPLGNLQYANEIYDPATRAVAANGLGYATPFPGNVIPATRFSPLTLKLENLISSLGVAPTNSSLTQNYSAFIAGQRYSVIPSIKIDHNINAKNKLSFFYSENNTVGQISSPLGNADGLPTEIGAYRGTFIPTYTERLNYDRTIAPTMLLHVGVGYIWTSFGDQAANLSFDPSQFGLVGFLHDRQFPTFTGMSGADGGMQPIGTSGQIQSTTLEEKPTYNANLTWIKGKHTYKFGASLVEEATSPTAYYGETFTNGTGPTSEPYTPTVGLGSFSTGFGYASWLLGDYSAVAQTPQTDPRDHDMDWALFAQDSWKVTRKLTVDYGLRWDLFGVETEQYGRLGQFNSTLPNPNAGGRLGATQYASTCNCQFYKPPYPYAIGPRIGIAYQINPKTVFRAGWGFTYALVENLAGGSVSTNGAYPLTGINPYVNIQTPGFIQQPIWPVTNPNIYPTAGLTSPAPTMPDPNQNRPPRVNQWSVGFQREITRNFILEASYVANRAAGLSQTCSFFGAPFPCNGNGGLTHVPASIYAQYGLYPYPGTGPAGYNYAPAGVTCTPGNDCDRAILSQPLTSTAVIQKLASVGISSVIPYSCAAPCGFVTSNSLSTVVGRPYPQFGAIGAGSAPVGDSKYDSLQVKATKRLSHGLQASGFFTWAQGFTRAAYQDYFHPASNQWSLMAIPPRTLNFTVIYTVPKAEFLPKIANQVTKDWQVSFFGNYQSGAFLAIPTNVNITEFLPTQQVEVPGVPLYLKNVNGQINPYTDIVLNPAAWAQCPVNSNCGDSGNDFLKGFRGRRKPSENANLGRNFRIKERFNFQIRGEFVNIFNRTQLGSPSTTAPQTAVARNSLNILTGGFGSISAYAAPGTAPTLQPRTGTLIARFSF